MKPSTERPTICVAGLHAGPVEQRRQRHALPRGVADEVAADLVGHALQRDGSSKVGHGDELVVGERERLGRPCP